MGLDMYLTKRIYPESSTAIIDGENISISYAVQEVGYWRKANAIHRWFVENVQEGVDDCKEYWVSKDELKKLYDTICEVYRSKTKAKELLPTQSGFFFGGVDYDDYYYEDLKYTKKLLEEIFKDTETTEYCYRASW